MSFGQTFKKLLGLEAEEKPKTAEPAPAKMETPDDTNERIARTAYSPDAYEKFKARRADKAAEEIMAVKTSPEEELKRIREQLPYFSQFDLAKLNDEELTKLQTQIENELENLRLLPITQDTETVRKPLEDKKTEIIETLTKQIEHQVAV